MSVTIDPAAVPDQFHLYRPPTDDDELWWYVQGLWGITIPRVQVCRNHCAPFDAFADAYFARSTTAVWWGSRGFAGKTRTLAALSLTEAVGLGAETSVLGGSGAQSLNVNEAGAEMWNWCNSPRQQLMSEPTKYDTWFRNGAHIRTLMASQNSVRGQHPQRMRLDEIDEMDLPIYDAASGCAMRKKRNGVEIETHTVASSTWQYPDKTMAEVLRRSRDRGWPTFQWCWRETSNPVDGWLSLAEVERKRGEVPDAMWEAEYDLQEPSFENRAIDTASVEACFDRTLGETDEDDWSMDGTHVRRAPRPKGRTNGNGNGAHPVYDRNHDGHVTGVDWAKEQDLTVITTFDARTLPWTAVAIKLQNRKPWPVMVADAERRHQSYPGTFAHDATGIGNVVSDYLDPRMRRDHKKYHEIVMGGGRARQDLFSEYISAIENGDIRYPRIKRVYEEHKYVTLDDLFGKGHPPDSVVAGAIAWHVRKAHQRPRVTGHPGMVRSKSPWF